MEVRLVPVVNTQSLVVDTNTGKLVGKIYVSPLSRGGWAAELRNGVAWTSVGNGFDSSDAAVKAIVVAAGGAKQ